MDIVLLSGIIILNIFIFIAILFGLSILISKNDIKKKVMRKKKNQDTNLSFIRSLTSTLLRLSESKIGAIIVIENKDSLEEYINIGYKILASFSPELVVSMLFNKHSPLHDGAIIVRDTEIVSVSSYLPITSQVLNVGYGARHRAAYGLSEKTDSHCFVVSETSGNISYFKKGKLTLLSTQYKDDTLDFIKNVLLENNKAKQNVN
jgi:diadenylate cyclase